MNKNNEKLAITLGDPSGIGPEVIIKAIKSLYKVGKNYPIIIGDTETLQKTAKKLQTGWKDIIMKEVFVPM